ncbi:MAG TPA: GxxExxY protein [Geothrix sp.]|jgi:GxxExxY protein
MTQMDSGDPRTYAILGVAMEVHRSLGPGFLEAVYQEALAVELEARGIPFRREVELPVIYKGRPLKTTYRADFICFGSVILELKSVAKLGAIEEAQILNYLKATGYEVGLLVNFAESRLTYKRFANSLSASSAPSAVSN